MKRAAGYEGHRGDAAAYDRYLAGMDASMRQKVALTAAHLLSLGRLADMGMGSGGGSVALASLYPGLEVIGVDVDPEMVARARERHVRPNLSFEVGDIASACFPARSLDAILDSSVLHHVTSYNGYVRALAARALTVQVEALRDGGILIVRDFLDPGEGEVLLDVRDDDGDDGDDPRTCSTAALLRRFSREFRVLRDDVGARGFPLLEVGAVPEAPAGWRRFRLARVHAVEFALRKDYRRDWETEVQEEYTYLSQPGFEAVYAQLGLRVLGSTPIRNPWIIQHRFEGQLALWDAESGEALDWPATNYVIVGERAPEGEGVRFDADDERALAAPGYLELSRWRRVEPGGAADGVVYDLVRRPGATIDVLPWFERQGTAYVLTRRSYPRPIAERGGRGVDGSTAVTYVSEPLNVRQGDKPIGQTVEELLAGFDGLGADAIRRFEPGGVYYPSPGGLQEEVRSVLVEVAPVEVEAPLRGTSGFSTSGVLRAIEARQLLRAAQVGALPDARLEMNVYELLLRRGLPVGPWLGAEIALAESAAPRGTTMAALARRPRRRRYRRATSEETSGFLQVRTATFVERDAGGAAVGRQALEWVVPTRFGAQTVAIACLRRADGAVWIGVDDDDLPAAQCFDGHSDLLVTPAWRLPVDVGGERGAVAFARERLAREYGLRVGRIDPLGGRWHPSLGATPEAVHAWAAEVTGEDAVGTRVLSWVRLDELVRERATLVDGHLRVVALRAAHALGLLSEWVPDPAARG